MLSRDVDCWGELYVNSFGQSLDYQKHGQVSLRRTSGLEGYIIFTNSRLRCDNSIAQFAASWMEPIGAQTGSRIRRKEL